MAKVYYKFRNFGNVTIPSSPTPSRIYTLFQDGSTIYGFDDKPYNYVFKRADSGYYYWYYANQGTTLDSTTRIDIGYGQSVSTPRISIYYAVDEGSQWDNFMRSKTTPVTLSNLNGKYRIISSRAQNYQDTLTASYTSGLNFIPIITDFTIGNTLYKGFIITGSVSSSTYTGKNIKLIREDKTVESYTVIEFASTYNNSIIEFANTDIPKKVADWFTSFLDTVYPYTYTVKNNTGEITLGEITEAPPMTNALLTIIGNQKTLTLTGINEVEYSIQWTSDTPEGKAFIGLSNSPNSNRAIILANTSISVSWVGDVVLYESYGTYRPPATTFDINIYQNTAESNRVDKTNYLVGVGTLIGALRDYTSITDLSITFQMNTVPQFNYIYIPIFNRYYFVTDIASVKKNLWEISASCDVLMTYKDALYQCAAFIDRNEIDYNRMIVDNKTPLQQGQNVTTHFISNNLFSGAGTYVIQGLNLGVKEDE